MVPPKQRQQIGRIPAFTQFTRPSTRAEQFRWLVLCTLRAHAGRSQEIVIRSRCYGGSSRVAGVRTSPSTSGISCQFVRFSRTRAIGAGQPSSVSSMNMLGIMLCWIIRAPRISGPVQLTNQTRAKRHRSPASAQIASVTAVARIISRACRSRFCVRHIAPCKPSPLPAISGGGRKPRQERRNTDRRGR